MLRPATSCTKPVSNCSNGWLARNASDAGSSENATVMRRRSPQLARRRLNSSRKNASFMERTPKKTSPSCSAK